MLMITYSKENIFMYFDDCAETNKGEKMSDKSFLKRMGVKDFDMWKTSIRAPSELHYLWIYADGEWVYFRVRFWTYMPKVLIYSGFGT